MVFYVLVIARATVLPLGGQGAGSGGGSGGGQPPGGGGIHYSYLPDTGKKSVSIVASICVKAEERKNEINKQIYE